MTAKDAWKKLLKIYPNHKPSNELFGEFEKIIGKFSPSVIASAYENTVEFDTRFPSIALFRSYCYEFQDRDNIKRHEAQKKHDEQTANAFYKQEGFGGNDYGRKCVENIRLALSGQFTRREFVENCKDLNIPTAGMMDYFQKHDFDMDNILGAEYMHDFSGTKGKKINKIKHREII